MSATIVALLLALAACVTDVRTRRIPNILTFGAASAALVFFAITGGAGGLGASVAGWVVGAAVFLPIFLLGGMGAGDVKLMAALGAWLGPQEALVVAFYGTLAGGISALVFSLYTGYLRTALRNVWSLLKFWWHVGPRPMEGLTLDSGNAPRLAFAVPIACGVAVALWL